MQNPVELIFAKPAEKHNANNPKVEVRNFPNNMNNYKISFRGTDEQVAKSQRVPLSQITAPRVALMYPEEFREHSFPKSGRFLKSALKLKNEIVQATWTRNGLRVEDPTMYAGVLGTAFLCFKAYLATGSRQDLMLLTDIVDSCCATADNAKENVTFLCGQPGIYALGAVAAKLRNDPLRRDFYLSLFNKVANRRILSVGPAEEGMGLPYELLNGRAGFLYAALFLNHHIGPDVVPWSITGPIVDAVLASGRANSTAKCPLVYSWRSTRYWGAAHGLAGIMHVLMHFPLSKRDSDDVKATLRYMIQGRYLRGNYRASEGNSRGDRLVHWCHGAPGIAITLCKAIQTFPQETDFRDAAIAAADVVWERGLLRRLGLCHGISGNTYVFLSLYRIVGGKEHLFRARQFAGWLHKHAKRLLSTGEMHGGDHRHSLFEGLAGTACLWIDVARPENSRFPGYEI